MVLEPLIESVTPVVYGVALGIAYAVYGYLTKAPEGEPFVPRKVLRTAVLYAVAGGIVGYGGGSLTQGSIESVVPSIGVVGVLFDHAWGRLKRDGRVPDWFGEDVLDDDSGGEGRT